MEAPYRALAVCGPTASGKSALGIKLAQSLSGEVLNVDSVQVYRHLTIGCAKVTELERQGVPHHLLDLFEPDQPANVGQFRECALVALKDVVSREKLPIVVGGSGMYLTALLHGLAELPESSEEVRWAVRGLSPDEQYAELLSADPETAQRLSRNDTQRVSRAVEVIRMTGRKLSSILAEHRFSARDVVALIIVLCKPRDELYRAIDQRVVRMLEAGLVAETRDLVERFRGAAALKTLGYAQAREFMEGRLPEAALATEIALHTRRFAKRQMTYWRNEPLKRGWRVYPGDGDHAEEVGGFESSPQRAHKRMKGFRALRYSESELQAAVKERLSKPLDTSEVWMVWLR